MLGESACRLVYYTLARLLDVIRLARLEGKELKFFKKMEHLDLLIIDDFGMKKLEDQQKNDFEQIIDDRYHKKSLIPLYPSLLVMSVVSLRKILYI